MLNRQPQGKKRTRTQTVQSHAPAPNLDFAQEEDMPIHRYVNPIPGRQRDDWIQELKELNLILDYQNKILVEILAALTNQDSRT
ncbi:MAG: hypothetical protein HFF39_01525 [Lawsonibacter sp.]|nr:hypothetical protein [Lawsonibacter sp.]